MQFKYQLLLERSSLKTLKIVVKNSNRLKYLIKAKFTLGTNFKKEIQHSN